VGVKILKWYKRKYTQTAIQNSPTGKVLQALNGEKSYMVCVSKSNKKF
jgi:hypothetical protein